jgi:ABC-2 type transport system permease protein
LLGHVAVTVSGSALLLGLGGAGVGVGYALTTGEGSAVDDYVLPTLAHLPSVLVLAGLARLLHGLTPRVASLTWPALIFCFVVMMFGEVFRMPEWLQAVSPFEHLALMPAEDFAVVPFVVVAGVAVLLSVAGQFAFSHRDVH